MRESIDMDLERLEEREARLDRAIDEAIEAAVKAADGEVSNTIHAVLTEHGYHWITADDLIEEDILPEDLVIRLRNEEGY